MGEATPGSTLDRVAVAFTQLAGAGIVALAVWGMWVDPNTSALWALCWAALGVAVTLLYTPALRLGAIACLCAAALCILTFLSPFSAMDAAPSTLEKPDFITKRIAFAFSLSALFVLLAFCLERARRVKRALRRHEPLALNSEQAEPASPPRPH